MHEVGLMSEAIALAEETARAHGAQRIVRLVLRVGPWSGVDPAALRFAFDAVADGTLAANATLDVEETEARAWCDACRSEFPACGPTAICPTCAAPSADLRQGDELLLARLEVE